MLLSIISISLFASGWFLVSFGIYRVLDSNPVVFMFSAGIFLILSAFVLVGKRWAYAIMIGGIGKFIGTDEDG